MSRNTNPITLVVEFEGFGSIVSETGISSEKIVFT